MHLHASYHILQARNTPQNLNSFSKQLLSQTRVPGAAHAAWTSVVAPLHAQEVSNSLWVSSQLTEASSTN
jgi:hypothetical protein